MDFILQFMEPTTLVTKESASYRPPSFPPPEDWPVSIDRQGNPLSFYGDDYWDFSAFGYYGFHFGKHGLSRRNLELIKQATLFVMYHPGIFPGRIKSCRSYVDMLVKIGLVCDCHGISISDLHKFPAVFPAVVDSLQSARILDRISQLHKLQLYEHELGFCIASNAFLKLLARDVQGHETVQHPYIPPRLWSYQVERLNELLSDFESHQNAIEDAFRWMHQAYVHNLNVVPAKYQSPFSERHLHQSIRVVYDGTFDDFLAERNLLDVFRKWLTPEKKSVHDFSYSTHAFSKYLSFVRDAAILFILNFSLQRKQEAASLRSDCFHVEHDPSLGDVYFLLGETTKTDEDSDARWVVPYAVKKAVDICVSIAKLRLLALREDVELSHEDRANPYLLFPSTELWSSNSSKVSCMLARHGGLVSKQTLDYDNVMRRGLKLFDESIQIVTEDDARIALSLTPNLHEREWFGVGKPWRFAMHQLRRTLAVNMFASQSVSVSTIQHQMKHLSRNMTLYYGRHYSRLRLNSVAQAAIVLEAYSSVYERLVDVIENDTDNVRPHGRMMGVEMVINLVDAGEEKKLMKLIRDGQVGARRTLLGFCMKPGACEYGGIESVSKCAGGGGGGICGDAIFLRKNKEQLLKLRKSHQEALERLGNDSMRVGALKQEIHAIEVYLDVIEREGSKAGC
ncbi:hypothetical protein ACTG2C_09490 [Aeromonas veronii]|uniref:hypothetical protein n=1 Tax=Aeromonas TaxID=642 RepID=UPI0012F67E6F|nr:MULTISPECIES: hypothetical protein [Aeromonas]QGW99150.1 hypothetical protein FGM04_21680 [Aeromonas veronii]